MSQDSKSVPHPLTFIRKGRSSLKDFLVTYYGELERAVGHSESVLDVGCGSSSPIMHFKNRVPFSVGVDGFEPSLSESRRQGIHDAYHQMNVLEIDNHFEPGSFDCVLALDVIEHLTKDDGFRLISRMEKVSRDRVIIFTPNGFQPQGEHSDNRLQRHLSGWGVEEMRGLGFDVIGINGFKPLLSEMARPRFRPRAFWLVFSRFTQYFVRNHPRYAFQILCKKHV